MARWGNCDFEQLKAFEKRLEKLSGKPLDDFCKSAAKELAARLLAKVIKRTPVGETVKHYEDVTDEAGTAVTYKSGKRKGQTKQKKVTDHMGGTLRRGWTAKTEAEAEGGVRRDATEYARSLPITKHGEIYQIEIVNPVHYASYVEYGHRQEPGRFVPAIGKRLKQGWVKGRFMLTISEQQLQAEAPALLEAKLKKFLGDYLNDQ